MEQDELKKLIEKARKDPEFFHALVFDPDKAVSHMVSADRQAKAAVYGIQPEELLAKALAPSPSMQCNWTCEGSCGTTCLGSRSCGYTCGADSCVQTCITARSCGATIGMPV